MRIPMLVAVPVAPIERCPSCGALRRATDRHTCDPRTVESYQREKREYRERGMYAPTRGEA